MEQMPMHASAGSYGSSMFSLFQILPNCFQEWLYYFKLLSAMYEKSNISSSFSVFGGVIIFYFSHSDRCIKSHYVFNLHFYNELMLLNIFSRATWCLYVPFSDRSVHVFCPFLYWIFSNVEFWDFCVCVF